MDKSHKWTSLFLASSLIISGCGLYTIEKESVVEPDEVVVVNTDLSSKIKLSLKDAPKEDCIEIYTFFSGLSRYISNLNNDDISTDEILNKTLLKAQQDYGWSRDKYMDLSTCISDDLTARKLDDPHKLSDVIEKRKIRDVLISALDEYASIVKSVVESK